MRSLQTWTTVVQWRWAPFVALVVGAFFVNLLIVVIVPSRIDTSQKSTPAANVLARPGLSDDDGEDTPFGAGATNPAVRSPQRSMPGFGAGPGPFGAGAPPPVQPFTPPPPVALPPPPAPPPPPVAAPPPEPEPPPPAPPPPVVPPPPDPPTQLLRGPPQDDDGPEEAPHGAEPPGPPGQAPPPPPPGQ